MRFTAAILTFTLAAGSAGPSLAQTPAGPGIDTVFDAADLDEARAAAAREELATHWDNRYVSMFVDLLDLMRRTGMVNPFSWIRLTRVVQFLEAQTGEHFGADVTAWRTWLWSRPYAPHPDYGTFKGQLYGALDRRFVEFFRPPVRSSIRLDEVDWGGVPVNGIPPLDHPAHVTRAQADYLDADNIIFGVSIGGVSRAYPQRILAWHEMALDTVGDRDITLVYCTLCGTVIPYESRVGGTIRRFGTSGLLYQSNKLMFDEETKSLWSSLDGTPVIGPLVGSGLRLSMLPVVTTTWAEWQRMHPDTTVLSLETGYTRDYSEGAAYRQYFATDALMFRVSRSDPRLRNKAEVLVLRRPEPSSGEKPVVVAEDFLRQHPVYHYRAGEQALVVLTTPAGANRVYEAGTHTLASLAPDGHVVDTAGRLWTVTEDALEATFDRTLRLPRVPAHRAFWFGWYAQHPDTVLIK